jgi:branched-subunit amino acid aminotransferase/4-amino-4-deoxychorismate lyase
MAASTFLHNGIQATQTDLARVAFAGFAHFTAMQIRDWAVPGLDLHLARLRTASDIMFGTHLSDDVVSAHLRQGVVEGPRDASVTVYVASTPGEFEAAVESPTLETFVRVTEPVQAPAGPVSLDVVDHVRNLPQVKHVGEVSKTLSLRRAKGRGFDDALFVDGDRHVSEASIWNIVFWDGSRVVWPRAAMLDGVTQQVLRRQLFVAGFPQTTTPVPVDRISPRWSAAIMNSWTPGIPVSRIGETPLDDATVLLGVLHEAFEAAERTTIA